MAIKEPSNGACPVLRKYIIGTLGGLENQLMSEPFSPMQNLIEFP